MPFLDWLLTCRLLCNARCAVHGRQGRRHPCRGAEAVSHGAVQQTTEILQLQSIDNVSMSLLCRSSKFSSADGEETVELPQLQLVDASTLSFTCPSLCNDRCRVVQTSENCESPAVAVHLNVVVDVPVVQVLLAKLIDSSSSYGGYGVGDGVFGGFSAFFALLRIVPELSASFWSPRWRRVLCHRGLPSQLARTLST